MHLDDIIRRNQMKELILEVIREDIERKPASYFANTNFQLKIEEEKVISEFT